MAEEKAPSESEIKSEKVNQKEEKIELISETGKQELLSLRIQNLLTTVNKLKYFLNSIKDEKPPLYYLSES